MKKLISIFMVMCMVFNLSVVAVFADVNANYANTYDLATAIRAKYSTENGYKFITASSSGTHTLTASDATTYPVKTGSGGYIMASSAVVLAGADETTTTNPTLPSEIAYQGLQGNSGFKDITWFSGGNKTNQAIRPYTQTQGLQFDNRTGNLWNNINFISDQIKSGKISYGFTFKKAWTTSTHFPTNIPDVEHIGGFGELKDSSIHNDHGPFVVGAEVVAGSSIKGTHYTDDKIVRARLDGDKGFAVYNKLSSSWATVIPVADINTTTEYNIAYELDLSTQTFDVTATYGETTNTISGIPFYATDYTAIDAIEFNTMGSGKINGATETNSAQSSSYFLMSVWMKSEEGEQVSDIIISEDSDWSSEASVVLAEGQSLIINDGAILRNAIIDATLGSVVIGETTIKGVMTFNEEGQLDVAENGTLNLKKAGDKENTYHWGLIKKVELSEVTSPYLVPLTASNGYTYDASFNLGTEGTFTGTARLLIGVQNVPEGVEITVE